MFFRPRAFLVAVAFVGALMLALNQVTFGLMAVAAGVLIEMSMWRGVFHIGVDRR